MLEEEAVRRSKPTVIAVRINMTGNTLNFISTCTPYEKQYRFGADIASRFEDCHTIRMDEVIHYRQFREDVRARLDALIPRDTALLIPTTPSLPLMKNSTGTQIGEFYSRALPLNSIAGHAGLPQVCLPMGNYDSCPLSLSLLGRRGDDHRLLQTAITIEKRFRETSMR